MSKKTASKKNDNDTKSTKYKISVLKDHTFDMSEILGWIELMCKGKFYYRQFKKNVVFTFSEVNDAFKFKLRWEIA